MRLLAFQSAESDRAPSSPLPPAPSLLSLGHPLPRLLTPAPKPMLHACLSLDRARNAREEKWGAGPRKSSVDVKVSGTQTAR
eukprot:2192084-Rhodomonas_salina.1